MWRFFGRFDRAGDADAFVAELRRGEARRWPFDPVGRRFVDPDSIRPVLVSATPPDVAVDDGLEMVFTWTERHWRRKWPTLEPRGRCVLARYLNRTRRWLVDVAPGGDVAEEVDAYLASSSLTVVDDAPLAAGRGAAWLRDHSLPTASVGRRELESLIERYSRDYRDPTRRVSAASIRRMVADLRPCWDRAVLEEVIPTNPWQQVDLGLRARAGGKRTSSTTLAADADLVLDPAQVWSLADACVEHGSWGRVVRASC